MPGKTYPADVLPCLPLQGISNRERQIKEKYINYVASNSIPIATSQREIIGNGLRDCHAMKVNFGSIVLIAK